MSQSATATFTAASGAPHRDAADVFRAEGVVVLKGIIPERVFRPVAEFLHEAVDEVDGLFARYGLSTRGAGAGAAVAALLQSGTAAIAPEDRHVLLGHFPLSVRLSPVLQTIPLFMREPPHLREILATDRLFAHMPPTARFVLPGNAEAAVPAHQDVSYNKHISGFCVMWVPLTEIDAECGGMAVYPRSQAAGELFQGPSVAATDGWLPAIDVSGFERVTLQPLSPGDVVLMSDRTAHQSVANTSSRTRLSVDFRIFGASAHSSKHYLDLQSGHVVAPQPGHTG